MGISIGGGGFQHGPGGTLRSYGSKEAEGRISGRVLLRLLRFVVPYWPQMIAATALMLISTGGSLLTPYLIKVAIDEDIASGDVRGLILSTVWIACSLVAVYAASAGQTYLLSWVGQRVLAALRAQLFRHLQWLSVPYHDQHIVGVTVSRVISDVEVINELLSQGLVTMLGDSVLLIGIVGIMRIVMVINMRSINICQRLTAIIGFKNTYTGMYHLC